MLIGIDASGSFDVGSASSKKPAVVAAALTSRQHYVHIKSFVDDRCNEWGLQELHAVHLLPKRREEVCRWIGEQDQLAWTAALTDSILFPNAGLPNWRQRQAAELVKAVEGRPKDEIETVLTNRPLPWHLVRIRCGRRKSLPTAHFVEFLFVLPRVIGDAVQTAIDTHDSPAWADEFDQLSIFIDDSTAKDAKVQIKDLLKPILAGKNLALRLPRESGLSHPFFAKHQRDGRAGDLRTLIGDRIHFVPSHSEPLCQIADMIAWVVRRAAADPSDSIAAHLYKRLRRRQHGIEGSRGVRVMAAKGSPADAPDRYRHVAALTYRPVQEPRENNLIP